MGVGASTALVPPATGVGVCVDSSANIGVLLATVVGANVGGDTGVLVAGTGLFVGGIRVLVGGAEVFVRTGIGLLVRVGAGVLNTAIIGGFVEVGVGVLVASGIGVGCTKLRHPARRIEINRNPTRDNLLLSRVVAKNLSPTDVICVLTLKFLKVYSSHSYAGLGHHSSSSGSSIANRSSLVSSNSA